MAAVPYSAQTAFLTFHGNITFNKVAALINPDLLIFFFFDYPSNTLLMGKNPLLVAENFTLFPVHHQRFALDIPP